MGSNAIGDCAPEFVGGQYEDTEPLVFNGPPYYSRLQAEPKLYGLWDGKEWLVDGYGMLFHTPYLRIVHMEAKRTEDWAPGKWAVGIIGPDGEPVLEMECP